MAALTTQNILDAGTKPTFATATASDTAEIGSGHNTFAVYKNTGSATAIVVVAPGTTDYGQPYPDPSITLPATTGEIWIPLRKSYDPGDGSGRATLTQATPTGVTVAVVRMS
jgi:hypothetical protein